MDILFDQGKFHNNGKTREYNTAKWWKAEKNTQVEKVRQHVKFELHFFR